MIRNGLYEDEAPRKTPERKYAQNEIQSRHRTLFILEGKGKYR
jgi:hypothetical protein